MTTPRRVLVVHERYAQRGGEDEAVDSDVAELERRGHQVIRWTVDNSSIDQWRIHRKALLFASTTWSQRSYRTVLRLVRDEAPDIVHFHNTLPIISPSAVRAAHRTGRPVVMTLHNYRLLCPAATFVRNGQVCEDCRTHSLLHGVVHGCYRRSRLQTAAIALMLFAHRSLGTWSHCVDAFVVLTEFMRSKLREGGLPAHKLHVRSSPVFTDVGVDEQPDDVIAMVGRLSEEKGVNVLLGALPLLAVTRVVIIGAGPLEQAVRAAVSRPGPELDVRGALPHAEAVAAIARAKLLVFPSLCYEGLPLAVLEAMSCGVPVVASRLGSMEEIIDDDANGCLFTPGDPRDLARQVNRVLADNALRLRLGATARRTFSERYSSDMSYQRLMEIYEAALRSSTDRSRR